MKTQPLADRIRHGELPNGYELQPKDVGKWLEWNFGNVVPVDVGKLIVIDDSGHLTMENDEQMMENDEQMKRRKQTGKQRLIQKALPESEGIQVYLSGEERNVVWDAIYGSRASGRYGNDIHRIEVAEKVQDKMRITNTYSRPTKRS